MRLSLVLLGVLIGGVTTAGFTWKYSKSLHGVGMSFAAGAMFGWTFGQEIANHWYQLYRLDTMQAQVKLLGWWKNKTEGVLTRLLLSGSSLDAFLPLFAIMAEN